MSVSAPLLVRLACVLLACLVAVDRVAAQSADLEPDRQAFNAILNDLSYLEDVRGLGKVDASEFRLDGIADEDFWSEAVAFTRFVRVEPATLTRPRYATKAMLAYSDHGLYVAFEMQQPRESLVEWLTGRDRFRGVVRDEAGLAIDASGEGRFGYFFNVALGGSLRDGTIRPERQFKPDWDGAWEARTRRTETGWSAEFVIPWSVISLPRSGPERRISVRLWRQVGHTGEEFAWPPAPDQSPRYLSVLQPLRVEGIQPSNKYQFVPYISSSYRDTQSSYQARAGVDASWRPSSNFQITSSLYPDFGNVEADDQDINLTAFEQFFPEKRIFFQEGVDLFITSPRSHPYWMKGFNPDPVYMLHTRRIGGKPRLPELGDHQRIEDRAQNLPNELYGAAKITGQNGSLEYGMLVASEQDELFHVVETLASGAERSIDIKGAGQDFAVARLKYEQRSDDGGYVGVGSFSGGVSHPDEKAFVQGVDWHYQSPGGRWQVDGQAIYTDTGSHGRGEAAHMEVARKPGFGVTQVLAAAYMSDSFDLNDIGYHRRNDMWMIEARHIRETTERPGFREFETFMGTYQQWNTDGDLIRSGFFYSVDMVRHNLTEFDWGIRYHPPAYEDWNTHGNGVYKKKNRGSVNFGISTDRSKKFSLGAGMQFAREELGGYRYGALSGVLWRPEEGVDISASLGLTRTFGQVLHHEDREMGEFDSKSFDARLELAYYPNERHQFTALARWNLIRAEEMNRFELPIERGRLVKMQAGAGDSPWDFTATLLTLQLRYRWQIAPLTDLFVVYSRLADERFDGVLDVGDVASDTWDAPLYADFIVKFRYRLGNL